jgi:hypothetical protein
MDDEEHTTKLTLTGEVIFSQSITKSQAGQIIAFLGTQLPMPNQAYSGSALETTIPSTTHRFETPRAAIDETGARTNPEKIVALASYVLQEGTRDAFSLEDIKPLFKRAGEVTPKNLGRDLISAVKAGYITESNQRGDYYFTKKASSSIENGFEAKALATKEHNRTGYRSRKLNAQTLSDEIKNIEITTTILQYPGFYELKTKSDKFLWVLVLAKKSNVGSLSASEVAFVSDAIGEGIPSSDVNSYFRLNQKKNFVNKSLQDKKIRITPSGEEYLKKQSESRISND